MKNEVKEEARQRIINASASLFSEKGFDATSVSEIAQAAGVNKALIYYYFKSKEDILDYLIGTLFQDMTGLSMDFAQDHIIDIIKEGKLDILPDRFHFTDQESIDLFIQSIYAHYERLLGYVLERRHVFRILLLESLKRKGHQNDLFRFFDLLRDGDNNPVYTAISTADSDFTCSAGFMIFKFFFVLIPIVSFAAYYDDYKALMQGGETELRALFVRSIQFFLPSFISGTDILLFAR